MTAIPLSCPLAPSDSSSVPGSPWELLGGPRGHLCGAQRWQCQMIFPPPCCCRFQGDEVSRIQRCTKQSRSPSTLPSHTQVLIAIQEPSLTRRNSSGVKPKDCRRQEPREQRHRQKRRRWPRLPQPRTPRGSSPGHSQRQPWQSLAPRVPVENLF